MTNFRRQTLAAMLCAPLAMGAVAVTPAAAQATVPAFHDVAELDRLVADSLGAPVGSPDGAVAPIDRRLRLAACDGAVQIDPPLMGAATVRCVSRGWRIRVPVAGPARAQGGSTTRTQAVPIVRRGDEVALVIATGGFTVSGSGIAESGGAEGDRIRVRIDRARSVSGAIRADGSVVVSGFN